MTQCGKKVCQVSCPHLGVLSGHVGPGCMLGVVNVPQGTPHQAVAFEAAPEPHLCMLLFTAAHNGKEVPEHSGMQG